MIHGFDVYKMYLAMKLHFSNPNYDFFQYEGKVRANEETYQQRKDFYFFETIARKYKKEEIQDLLLASFILSENPKKVWIGDIRTTGRDSWMAFQKLQQSLNYTVEQDTESVVEHMGSEGTTFNSLFETMGGHHPRILRLYIKRQINLETLIIYDMILGFMKNWDKKLTDPLWEGLSFKIKKYKPFLSINTSKYRELMKQRFS
jgi:hypothetical protein